MESRNNGVPLCYALFAGLLLVLVLMCAISLCGCAGRQQPAATPEADAVSEPDVVSRLSATLPNLNDEDAWQRGLGIVMGVIVPDMDNQPAMVNLSLYVDFGNNTNTIVSDELNENLRLVAEILNRLPDNQNIVILAVYRPGMETVNVARAQAIALALMSHGVTPDAIVSRTVSTEDPMDTEEDAPGIEEEPLEIDTP